MNGQPQPQIPPLAPIQSSHLSGAHYDLPSKTLYVGFHDQSVYAHAQVPPAVYQALTSAKSPGHYYNARIKGQFKTAKLKSAPKVQAQPAAKST